MTKEQKEAFEKQAKPAKRKLAKNKELNEAYTKGKDALEAKQWDAAVENLAKASTLDAKQGAVWSALADAYVGKAQATPPEAAATYEKAFDAFNKALEISPDRRRPVQQLRAGAGEGQEDRRRQEQAGQGRGTGSSRRR